MKKYLVEEVKEKGEWDELFLKSSSNNLFQSWEYGDAKKDSEGWILKRLVIFNIDRKPIAIVQVLIKGISFLGYVARINRGPILINKKNADDYSDYIFCMEAIKNEAKKRWWWFLYISPELEESESMSYKLQSIGLCKRKVLPYGSALINLKEDIDSIFMNLNGKWRNLLRKSQKSDFYIKIYEEDKKPIDLLIKKYKDLQVNKKFTGISNNLLKSLERKDSKYWNFKIFTAYNDISDDIPSMVVTITHGNTTSYMIGYSDEIGRKSNLNYLLLWEAIKEAKKNGGEFFDLGGLNANTPKGVLKFKSGLNGKRFSLIGEYLIRQGPF